nr:proprotein convertase subtilisin/kexin type 4 isoform X2 [Mirounga angustirostris]
MRPAQTALWLRLVVALGLALVGPLPVGWPSARAPIYVSSWAVRVSQGYREAERLARKFGFVNLGQIFPDGQYYHLRHRGVVQQSLTPHWGHRLRLRKDPKVQWFEQQTLQRRVKRSVVVPTDPWFSKQWYMNNKVQPDLNILQVWSQGLSGQGIVVSVLDDGIEKDHPDLWANYDPLASYDFNDYDPDPQPRYTPSDENRHGTRCAGEVAAIANNGFCGTGVAYNARIGGVRMLDGTITDVIEAQSLSLQPQHIHIYSASWGPEDDGRTVDGPGILTREAFRRGVTKGRGGLGTLFVWASGNGGLHYDNCNCDGYTNSIHTLSVGSTTRQGHVPWYSEACASTLTTTYSSGVAADPQIVTTDLHHQCTDKHTGTSASAPLAAGMIALALEANPFLTWRDMQHLVVRASRPAQLQAEDWRTNGVGRQVSHHYGYGLLDARLLVDTARTWLPTRPQQKCAIRIVHTATPILPLMQVRKNVSACAGRASYIRSLEHVQVQLSLSYSRRGDLEISLTSPMGTRSTLVAIRPLDVSGQGYNNWIFMSTHFWDEDPQGLWTLGLENKGYYFNTGESCMQAGASGSGAARVPHCQGAPSGLPERPSWCVWHIVCSHRRSVPGAQWVLSLGAVRGWDCSSGSGGWGEGPRRAGPGCQQPLPLFPTPTATPAQGRCTATRCCCMGRPRTCRRGPRAPRMPRPCLHPGPPLPFLLPPAVLQPHPAGSDRGAGALGPTRPARLLELPPFLLHLPWRFPTQLHHLPPRLHAGRASGLLLRTCPSQQHPWAHRSGPPQLPPWPSPGRGPGLAGHGLWEPLPLQRPLRRLPAAVWGPPPSPPPVWLLAGT